MQNLNDFLQRSTAYLAIYLENKLPELYKDWWRDGVLTNLNPTQLRRIEQNQITSIKSLDLAALLRILDNNWFEIASKDNLPTENRHYIKKWCLFAINGRILEQMNFLLKIHIEILIPYQDF